MVVDVPRIFIDADILIRGTSFPRFPYEILVHAMRGEIRIVLSPLVLESARRRIREEFPQHLHRFDVLMVLVGYESVDDPRPDEVQANANLVRDRSDVPIALSAIKAKVDYLVTGDPDFTDVDVTTQELHEKIRVMRPGTFLKEVMGWSSEDLAKIERRNWSDL